jgi:hypothetical protein
VHLIAYHAKTAIPTIQHMVDWGDALTRVTAGVAFMALIGAVLAYRTQSEQLRLQRIQLEDRTRIQEREQANLVDCEHREPRPA